MNVLVGLHRTDDSVYLCIFCSGNGNYPDSNKQTQSANISEDLYNYPICRFRFCTITFPTHHSKYTHVAGHNGKTRMGIYFFATKDRSKYKLGFYFFHSLESAWMIPTNLILATSKICFQSSNIANRFQLSVAAMSYPDVAQLAELVLHISRLYVTVNCPIMPPSSCSKI